MGMLDDKGGEVGVLVGVSDDDVNEVGIWGWEDGTEVDGTSVDAEEAGGLPEEDVDGSNGQSEATDSRTHMAKTLDIERPDAAAYT